MYTYWSQELAFSPAIVCMKVDYSLRMHHKEALFQILRPCGDTWQFVASEFEFIRARTYVEVGPT